MTAIVDQGDGHRTGGGGGFAGGDISLWEISYFKCVRNFLLNFQATVRNKPDAKFSHVRNLGTGDSPDLREGCFSPPPPLPWASGFHSLLTPPPPLFPVSCPILHLALLSENDDSP